MCPGGRFLRLLPQGWMLWSRLATCLMDSMAMQFRLPMRPFLSMACICGCRLRPRMTLFAVSAGLIHQILKKSTTPHFLTRQRCRLGSVKSVSVEVRTLMSEDAAIHLGLLNLMLAKNKVRFVFPVFSPARESDLSGYR